MDLNFSMIAPELSLLVAVALVLIVDMVMRRRAPALLLEGVALAGLILAFIFTWNSWQDLGTTTCRLYVRYKLGPCTPQGAMYSQIGMDLCQAPTYE